VINLREMLRKILEEVSKEKDLFLQKRDNEFILSSKHHPIKILVVSTSSGYAVKLYCENLRDFIEDLLEEENPRETLENILSELSNIAYTIHSRLRENGMETRMMIRDFILDALEELEDAIEEG